MVATTSSGELVVSEFCKISIDRDGERIRNIDTTSVRSGIRRYKLDPWGFAVDEDSNITDWESHRLFKFNSDGKLVKSVGGELRVAGQDSLIAYPSRKCDFFVSTTTVNSSLVPRPCTDRMGTRLCQ